MFNWSFNIYGSAIAIILFLISFIFNWIFKVNYKNKYRTMQPGLSTNAVKIGKNYLELNHKKASYRVSSCRFWNSIINDKVIALESEDFYGNSLYALQEVLFKTVMHIKNNKWIIKQESRVKIMLFLTQILTSLCLIMGFWLGLIIGLTIFVIIFMVEQTMIWKFISQICKQVVWLLQKNGISKKVAHKSLFLNKLYFIDKYISVFSESYISGLILLKKWGTDE